MNKNSMAKLITSLILLFVISFAFIFSVFSVVDNGNSDSNKPAYNRYNIVLVVDASGSMATTDMDELRFEAIGKFVALLAERGNKIGTVVFSDQIVLQRPMTDVNDISIKRKIVDEISMISPRGYTNIGGALNTAIDLLDQGAAPDLPSIILFLSDGNTEMATADETRESILLKADAIERARSQGYNIHSVSLNADGTASPDELSQISNATGGLFEEVKYPADLESVYNMFYSVIFNSLDYGSTRMEFPGTGVIEEVFAVPPIGVEEINMTLSGNVTDYSLTDPNGRTYTKADLQDMTYSSGTFNIIKVVEPISGEWGYSVTGLPGDIVRIELIFNITLEAAIEIEPIKEQYLLSDTITVTAGLTEGGKVIDSDLYGGFYPYVVIFDKDYNLQLVDFNEHDLFSFEFTPQTSGAYTMHVKIDGWGYTLQSETITINVENIPPIFNEDIHYKINLLPFSDNIARIDLSSAVTDPLGRELIYEVVSSSFNDHEYGINNTELIMSPDPNGIGIHNDKCWEDSCPHPTPSGIPSYSLTKGSFEISAVDPLGGSVTFNVYVTTVNVTVLTLILLGAGGLIVLGILGIIAWLNFNKRFYGVCYVRFFDNESDEYYEEIEITNPKRGKRRMPVHRLKNVGINLGKCYFQASGKRNVWLCLNEVVYGQGVRDKKFKIDGEGFEVQISKRDDGLKGIIVRFESHKNR